MKPLSKRTILSLAAILLLAACQQPHQINGEQAQSKILQTEKWLFHDSIPPAIGWVNDYEHLYNTEEKETLDNIISAFEQQTGNQIAIVTLDSSVIEGDKFDAFTQRIFNTWGVGQKEKNNGIMIGISKGLRKIRVNTGTGMEKVLPDSTVKSIIDNNFIPSFKEGLYYKGTVLGLTEIINRLRNNRK